MSSLSIKGMEFYAYHGCLKEEQVIGGKYLVDVSVDVNVSKAQETDELTDTIDYQVIYGIVKEEMSINSKLLEHIANRIAVSLCNHLPLVTNVKVKVSKLNPPLEGKAEKVSVSVKKKNISET